MPVLGGTLARYFGLRFLSAVLLVFLSIFALVALLDYIELMRRAGDVPNVSPLLVAKTSIYRVPQIIERVMPFCILIGAMSSYLNLSRRLELVIARSAGMSAWQFITPAVVVAFLIGIFATTVYNPVSAVMQERSKKLQAELFGRDVSGFGGGGRRQFLGQPEDQRGPGDHQRQVEPRPGRRAQRGHGLHLRHRRPLPATHRGAGGGARPRGVAAVERPCLRARQVAGGPKSLPAQDEPDARAST